MFRHHPFQRGALRTAGIGVFSGHDVIYVVTNGSQSEPSIGDDIGDYDVLMAIMGIMKMFRVLVLMALIVE